MKKMYKTTALSFLLILVLAMAAGCGAASRVSKMTDGEEAGAEVAEATEAATSYEVLVTDEAGNPVPGAMVQFCSDTECMQAATDDAGIASFDREPGAYTIHVLKVPEGFAKDKTEYTAPEEPGRVTIVLKAE